MNYYNEWDNFAAEWLRELIKDGLIPDGEVDTRSIADVRPEDLKGFTQCHFFAGIGGWSRALQLAGWSPDRPVWTGSPPCQPFSTAGKQSGKDDLRHLWPAFFNLIRECSPPTIFGEQVASAIRFGWLDDLQRDLEAEGYAAAAVVLPGGAVSAPHKRDRLFFTAKRVADTTSRRHKQSEQFSISRPSQSDKRQSDSSGNCESQRKRVADSNNLRHEWSAEARWEAQRGTEHTSSVSLADSNASQLQGGRLSGGIDSQHHSIRSDETHSCLGDTKHDGSYETEVGRSVIQSEDEGRLLESERSDTNIWDNPQIIYCRDGKYRPIPTEPSLFPLANGISNRVGILRGAGNAIVPQAAAEIIKAVM